MSRDNVLNGVMRKLVIKLVMLAVALVVGFASLALTVQPAAAHGEKSQQAFLRMRTLQ